MKNKGFSLVELIVVIAIMAILVGVAVPVYSSYIEKTQKAADQQLVDEVAHALAIYAINNPNQIGYVVLTPEKVDCQANKLGADAMKATFGDNWKEDLFLHYDGWVDAFGGADSFVANAEIQKVLDESVSLLTDMATTVIEGNKTNANVNGIVAGMLGDNASEVVAELDKYKDDPNYSTIASNLIIKYVAEELKDVTFTVDENGLPVTPQGLSEAAQLTMMYSMLYTMSEETGADGKKTDSAKLAEEKLSDFNEDLAEIVKNEKENPAGTSVVAQASGLLAGMMADQEFGEAYVNYAGTKGITDWTGLSAMLGLVDSFADNYSDKDSLANDKLYQESELLDLVGVYQQAAELGGVVVMIKADGAIVYLPVAVAPGK